MARRPSSIDRMPAVIKDWIGRLRDQGRTLDEIIAKLRELDVEALPSRSALHRHLQKIDRVSEKMRRSRDVAEVLVRRLGDGEMDKATRLNIELMHSAIFDLLASADDDGNDADGQPVTLDPMQVMLLSKAIDHLGKASKDDVARTITIEKRAAEKARAEALKDAADTAASQAREAGMSEQDIARLRRNVLGLRIKQPEQGRNEQH